MRIENLRIKYESLPVQVKASFWFLICSFLQKGISMITTPIYTRILSTADYGQYGVFNSWYSIAGIIVALSLTAGVHTQGLIKFDQERAVFSSSLQGLTTVLVVGWTVVYLLFHNAWNQITGLNTAQMLALLVMVWTSSTFGFWANEQRVNYSYKVLVIVTLLVSLAKPVLSIFLILHSENKVTVWILSLMLVELIGFSWMFVYQIKRGKHLFSKKFWKYALVYNLPLVPHYLSQIVLNSSDRIMIQKLVDSDKAGIYNLAYAVALIMTLFNTALMQTISPWMYEKIKQKKGKEIAPVAYLTLMLIAIVNIVLILLAPEVVAIFAPKAYYEAIWVIPPVAMSVFFMYSYDLYAKFAFYYEKTKFIMAASVMGAVLNLVLNYYCIQAFGYIAAGYTTLICFIVYTIAHYAFMKRVCKQYCDGEYPYDTRKLLVITIVFLAVGFLLLPIYNYPIIRYSIIVVVIVIMIVFRKKLMSEVKGLMALKKRK